MNRRTFIQLTTSATAGTLLTGCADPPVPGAILGTSAQHGHLLRDHLFGPPVTITEQEVVIVGGGVSGLSAARALTLHGISGITLLELDHAAGGNAASGSNQLSAYPWGAHYVPVPNNSLTEYLDFLRSCGIITGHDATGLPVYREEFLCFDPQERLYMNGRWQDGLVPHYGLSADENAEITRFFSLMNHYKTLVGNDGREAFAIPADTSSHDKDLLALDTVTFKTWLLQNGFRSNPLHWYADYTTRDDYGTTYGETSAWAGIHYHACRKGKGSNASYQDVLTWPEGNGRLVRHLKEASAASIRTDCLVVNIKPALDAVLVTFLDLKDNQLKGISARSCIAAVPQFVAARLLGDAERLRLVNEHLEYAPWMVANLRVDSLEERSGSQGSWDNVLYGTASLGYVNAMQQLVQQPGSERNLTYYVPLTGGTPREARRKAMAKTHGQWVQEIVQELQIVHPNIRKALREVDIRLWGHAMAQPRPGFFEGRIRKQLAAPIGQQVYFAHTDLAGISIFEEAFYQGWNAAQALIKGLS